MINLLIDSKESSLIQLCKKHELSFQISNLVSGDIECNDGIFRLLFERKTLNDLHSSICDGRYREQRSRLLALRSDTTKFAYCIDLSTSSLHNDILQHDMVILHRLVFSYDIPLFFFTNTEQLVLWIKWIIVQSSLSIFFKKRDTYQDQIENILISKNIHKKDVINSKTWFSSSLLCLNGISYSIANAISNEFKSWSEFSKWIHHCDSDYSRLQNIVFSTPKRPIQKLGNKLSLKIISFFSNQF